MQKNSKILIIGRSGAGKTVLAKALSSILGAVHFSADDLRKGDYSHLPFSEDPVQQSRRMSRYCDSVAAAGRIAIADLVCPTPEARQAFGPAFLVWVDRACVGDYEHSTQLFEPPSEYDVRVLPDGSPGLLAQHICRRLQRRRD
jgi:energy-coupling factor transporter ATP-binding protein EcfA2